jgi:NAD(P)-dependent dehydrogenase (short-subunit alcohol dehydrogenase family)
VVVSDIDDEAAMATAEESEALGRRTHVTHCDVSDPDEIERPFSEADEHFGRVGILANVPLASPERVRPHDSSLKTWERTPAVQRVKRSASEITPAFPLPSNVA